MLFLYLLAALLIAGIGAGLCYEALGLYLDSRRMPPPGRLINIGSGRLHLYEQGAGSPTVVLESGIASTSLAWALVQPEISQFTRVASYDRAGLGWSSSCHTPRNVDVMVSELASLLAAAALSPPYILVGHSFGGLLVRAYAHLHPQQVAGLVLVDPVCLSSWAQCNAYDRRRLHYGALFSRRGALLARFGVVRAALALLASGGRLLPRLIARASAPRAATNLMSNLVGQVQKLPPSLWPIIRSHWSNPKCFRSMAEHLACLPAAAKAVIAMPIPAGIPLIILSASNATPAELEERDRLAKDANGRHVRVEDTGHWIQLERPDAVIDAIRELVREFPNNRPIDGARRRE